MPKGTVGKVTFEPGLWIKVGVQSTGGKHIEAASQGGRPVAGSSQS